MPRHRTNKENLERGAKVRELVLEWLRLHTKPQSSTAILDGLKQELIDLGLSRSGGYFHVKQMADSGMVNVGGTKQRRVFTAKPPGDLGPSQPHWNPPKFDHHEAAIVEAAHRRAAAAVMPKAMQLPEVARGDKVELRPAAPTEVELVVAGITIVVGRNPVTGRARITIEG
jgi:hypothetical protein